MFDCKSLAGVYWYDGLLHFRFTEEQLLNPYISYIKIPYDNVRSRENIKEDVVWEYTDSDNNSVGNLNETPEWFQKSHEEVIKIYNKRVRVLKIFFN